MTTVAHTETTYRVVVSHDGDVWVADVPQLEGAHTQAGNLTRLDEAIREVIALVEDLPEGAESTLHLDYEYEGTGHWRSDLVDGVVLHYAEPTINRVSHEG